MVTEKQRQALQLLHSDDYSDVMLFGGRRSGKTYVITRDIIAACLQFAFLRALIARSRLNHVKASIWNQTLLPMLATLPNEVYEANKSELIVRFYNGSEIILAGFDDAERIDKHLGMEFAIIYANECSTIDYGAILLAQSSLAQNIQGFKNKMYYDMNPPAPTHWTYKLFKEKLNPKDDTPLAHPERYVSLLMNPTDNTENLTEDYIDRLNQLPDRERRRYLLGEFVKPEGAIYDAFDIDKHSIDLEDLPIFEYYTVGIDNTGTNFAAVLIGWSGDKLYILDEYSAYRETMQNFNATIYHKWAQYGYVAYPDPAAAQLNDLIWNVSKADNAVEPGINYLREKIENEQLFIVKINNKTNCPNLVSEIDGYHYDDKGRIVKEADHFCDALRYGTYSHAKFGGSITMEV